MIPLQEMVESWIHGDGGNRHCQGNREWSNFGPNNVLTFLEIKFKSRQREIIAKRSEAAEIELAQGICHLVLISPTQPCLSPTIKLPIGAVFSM